mmetsp:Transcript_7718/g.22392  ORF Transcript_7718/g.22392 Transcript_7718/m.22392 type:complete len:193 (+) Transcript_7718:3-581(+)
MNEHWRQDKEFRDLKREAEEACMQQVRDHLKQFLERKNDNVRQNEQQQNQETDDGFPTYEQWIEDLHPENAHEGKLLDGMDKEIDLRFYVAESDHLQLWNQHAPHNRQVVPRNRMYQEQNKPKESVDLLFSDQGEGTVAAATTKTTNTPDDPFAAFDEQRSSNSLPAASDAAMDDKAPTNQAEPARDLLSFD